MRNNIDKTLSILGMARRAGILIVGQDSVKSRLSHKDKLFVLFPEDAQYRSEKTFLSLTKKVDNYVVLKGVSMEQLAHAIGINSTMVVALPERSSFVSGIKNSLNHLGSIEGGVAVGKNESIRTCQDIGVGQQRSDKDSL